MVMIMRKHYYLQADQRGDDVFIVAIVVFNQLKQKKKICMILVRAGSLSVNHCFVYWLSYLAATAFYLHHLIK